MTTKRLLALMLSVCLVVGIIPIEAYATEKTGNQVSEDEDPVVFKPTNSLGQVGGYLSGNSMTAANLFVERKFTWPGGTGFAAERGNNLIDRSKGFDASVVGDDNVANGADRKIINRDGSITWIQDKYFPTARRSVEEAFDETSGKYRYLDGDERPMQLEVPADQYDDAVKVMKEKIQDGKVPGITDPDEAADLVRKGNLSYKQAANLAKAGTVESLTYDAANGAVTAAYAAGIGFVLDFTCCILNGAESEEALKNAGLNGLKTGGIVFATYVISSQLAKTGLTNALVPTAEAIAKSLGDDVCEAILLRAGVHATGKSATNAAAQIISKELVADGVLLVVLTTIDVTDLFRGRISQEEMLKNLVVTVISIGVGTAGGYGGAALGTMIAPGPGTAVGAIIGSVAGGGLSAWAAEALIAPFYESDAEEMFAIIRDEFTVLCSEYLISEDEGLAITENLSSKLTGDTLKDMYASEDRVQFARDLMEPLFIEKAAERPEITIPSVEDLRYEMKSTLQGVVFIH